MAKLAYGSDPNSFSASGRGALGESAPALRIVIELIASVPGNW
jgi:hypothetical protein